jgi:acyl-CoA reductase-like NAD-dependent aldehyde dehydrogenase
VFERNRLFIANQWQEPTASEWLEVISPATEAPAGLVPLATQAYPAMQEERQ